MRWAAFARFLDDGRIYRAIAAAECHRLRQAAAVPTLIEIWEINDAGPPAWLAHVLAKPRGRPAKRRDEWLPWN